MNEEELKAANEAAKQIFWERMERLQELIGHGRGIEIQLRIADQTKRELKKLETYQEMMSSKLEAAQSRVPKQAIKDLLSDPDDIKRLELSVDIADKLAHGLIRAARKLIDRYKQQYGLKTTLNNDPLPGWFADMKGHIIDEDGRQIDKIEHTLKSTNKNVIVEEFDVFTHNNYDAAAKEIFDDATALIQKHTGSLPLAARSLHMLQGFKRGETTYVEQDNAEGE